MNKIWIIFRKEVMDSLRDYRSWSTGLFWALFGPIMMGAMLIMIGSSVREDIEKPLRLPVQHPENAPNLIRFLEQHDVIIEPAPSDPETAVKQGDLNVVLVIPTEYGEDFSSGKTAMVQLILDSTRQPARVDIVRIQNLLENYGSYLGTLRLVVRGVSPEIIQAVAIEEVDVATPQSQATLLISFLPYFIIFAIFNGAAPIITDTTAGERERQSLEPLLINPVPRRKFVWGKLFAAFPFSLASLAITLIGFGIVFNALPVEEYLGIRIGLSILTLLLIFLICLPVVFLASAIQMLVASFARSTKEAGTYLPFIALVPSLPGLALAFFPIKPDLWTMLIPTFGQQVLINQFMRLEPISISNAFISTVVTIIISVAITFIAIKLYEREQIVIRKS
ncbi:MAG: ABC transporter permease [Chloroflexi bacterium]|nr:MAG: ABC transporter permease [Chloroflexota bacterium]